MAITNPPVDLYVGDTWQLDVSPTDAAGNPLPSDSAVEFALEDLTGNRLTIDVADLEVIWIAAGLALIEVTKSRTAQIVPGMYRYFIRVTTVDGRTEHQSVGGINAKRTAFVPPPI